MVLLLPSIYFKTLIHHAKLEGTIVKTPRPTPKWLTWSHSAKHLPLSFHSLTQAFEDFMTWLESHPYRTHAMATASQATVLLMCLGIGLILQDLATIQFNLDESEMGTIDPAALHLLKSKLNWAHSDALLKACEELQADFDICLEGEPENITITPPPLSPPPKKKTVSPSPDLHHEGGSKRPPASKRKRPIVAE